MTPEELEGKNGRWVLIEAAIIDCKPDWDGDIKVGVVRADGHPWLSYCSPSAIREILPEPIKVGDRVTWPAQVDFSAKVLAIHEDRAWVLYDDGRRNDWPLSDLTLVEPEAANG